MPVIDSHVHLYPPEINRDPAGWAEAAGERHWAALCTRRRAGGRPVQGFPDVADLLRAMDAAGVDRAVLLGWYWERPETCAWQNRFYAECVRAHPDRLAAFATVHPGAGATAFDEVRRAREDGLIGLGELSPHAQRVACDDPRLGAVLTLAGELGLPVNLHVTDPVSRPYPGRVETPLDDFVRLARTYPKARFILAHWAGGLDVRGLSNVWVDTAAAPLIYGPSSWSHLGRTVTPDRVLFGSDHPLDLYPSMPSASTGCHIIRDTMDCGLAAFVAEARNAAGWADDTRAGVLGGNAARLLRMAALPPSGSGS